MVTFSDASSGTSIDTAITSWLWFFGDGDSSNAQNPTHSYTSIGTYNVTLIVSNQSGCTDTIHREDYITVDTSTDMEEFTTEMGLNIHPNPFSNQTNITIEGVLSEGSEMYITDATGRVVKKLSHSFGDKIVLDRKGLAAGIYTLTLQTNHGAVHRKLVVR